MHMGDHQDFAFRIPHDAHMDLQGAKRGQLPLDAVQLRSDGISQDPHITTAYKQK